MGIMTSQAKLRREIAVKPPAPKPIEDAFETAVRDLEHVLGLRVTIHDLAGIFKSPAGEKLFPVSRTSHQHPCCKIERDEQACMRDCWSEANRELKKKGSPVAHRCHRNLVETTVPLIRDEAHLATLFAGPFRPRPDNQKKRRPSGVSALWIKHWRRLPVLDEETEQRVGRILTVFAQGLLYRLENLHRSSAQGSGRKAEVRRFLLYRAQEPVRLPDLAAVLNLSPSRAGHVVRELFGVSFRRLLLKERLQRARNLLWSQDYPVSEIARRVGFDDEYHFNRMFKAAFGLPPGRFRRKFQVGN
jgi:AraC family transcriptional regulator